MVWYFAQSLFARCSCFFLCHGSQEMCRLCWSQQKACFWHPFKWGKKSQSRRKKIEGNEEENFLIIFLSVFHISLHLFFEYFSLWWWYGKLRGRLRLLGSFVSFLIIFVSFSPKKKVEMSGNGILGNWNTFPVIFLFIARMVFMKFSPILLSSRFLFRFQASLATIFPSFTGLLCKRENTEKTNASVKKWTPKKSGRKIGFIVMERWIKRILGSE